MPNPKKKNNPKKKRNPKRKKASTTETVLERNLEKEANLGKEIELSFGTFTVKDLDVISIMIIMAECLDLVKHVASDLGDQPLSDYEIAAKVVTAPNFRKQFGKLSATLCGAEDSKPFETLNETDFLEILEAGLEVVDFERLQKTFLEKLLPTFEKLMTQTSTVAL